LTAIILKNIRQVLYKKCDFSVREYTKTFWMFVASKRAYMNPITKKAS
jgi:hypothetical protein